MKKATEQILQKETAESHRREWPWYWKLWTNTWLCISDVWLKENGTSRTDAYILLNLDKYLPSPSDGLDPRLLQILNIRKLCVRTPYCIYIADLCICLMKKAWTWDFEVRMWVQISRLRKASEVIKQQNMKLLITLIDLTANALTQKSSSFLPITLFKLNQKQARCISKTDMSWLSKKYKWVGLKSRLSKNFMTYFQSCLYFSYGFQQKGKIVSPKFAKFFFLRDHFACENTKISRKNNAKISQKMEIKQI